MKPTFADLKLNTPLLDALYDLGLTEPTPIQMEAFSPILSGRDVLGIAQTGTGKTFAYLMPILRNLKFSKQKNPRVLIIVPTRELVVQVVSEAQKLSKYTNIRIGGVYGGTNINTQKQVVAEGLDILVGTPGRIMDLSLTRVLIMSSIRQLVIDEVDEMLNLGFRAQLTTIFDSLPRRRQNLMFSATMTDEVDVVIDTFFNLPITIEVTRVGTPLDQIHQTAYPVANFFTKLNLLEHLLATDKSMQKVLIFGATKRMADRIHERLEARFPGKFSPVHSNKSQNYRLFAVHKFQTGEVRGLVTTDLLARGLDVTDVTHVINVDTPTEPESYIHRIGRTGRADAEGSSITFITPEEKPLQEAIEALMNKPIPMLPFPEEVEVSEHLTIEEQGTIKGDKNYLPEATLKYSQGAFHEKAEKNKKVNRGNKTINLKKKKHKRPLTRGMKVKKK